MGEISSKIKNLVKEKGFRFILPLSYVIMSMVLFLSLFLPWFGECGSGGFSGFCFPRAIFIFGLLSIPGTLLLNWKLTGQLIYLILDTVANLFPENLYGYISLIGFFVTPFLFSLIFYFLIGWMIDKFIVLRKK